MFLVLSVTAKRSSMTIPYIKRYSNRIAFKNIKAPLSKLLQVFIVILKPLSLVVVMDLLALPEKFSNF